MTAESLATWVAAQGGVRLYDNHGRSGELAQLRDTNRVLRGRRRVVAVTGGVEYDRLAIQAAEAGFPVTEDSFLDDLERDAWGLAQGRTTDRCIRDYDLIDSDFAYPEELDLEINDEHAHDCRDHERDLTPCGVCGRPCEDGTCSDCLDWAAETIREALRHLSQKRAVMAFFETMRGEL